MVTPLHDSAYAKRRSLRRQLPIRRPRSARSSEDAPSAMENEFPPTQKLVVRENIHHQSVWWRNVPFLYDRYLCTPLPQSSNICIPLPSHPTSPDDVPSSLRQYPNCDSHTSQYFTAVFDRARRLSSGTLTAHLSPPIDLLINSDSEVFIIRLELPLDPQRSRNMKATVPQISHGNLELLHLDYCPASLRPDEIQIGDFVSRQRKNLPSALGGAELIDIPYVVDGHLVSG